MELIVIWKFNSASSSVLSVSPYEGRFLSAERQSVLFWTHLWLCGLFSLHSVTVMVKCGFSLAVEREGVSNSWRILIG